MIIYLIIIFVHCFFFNFILYNILKTKQIKFFNKRMYKINLLSNSLQLFLKKKKLKNIVLNIKNK